MSIAAFGFLAFREVRHSSASAATEQLRTVVAQTADVLEKSVAQRFEILSHTASAPQLSALVGVRHTVPDEAAATAFLHSQRTSADSAVLVSQMLLRTDASTQLSLYEDPPQAEAAELRATLANASERDSAAISPLFAAGTEMHYWLVVPSRGSTGVVGYLAEQRRLRTSPLLEQQLKDLTGQDFSIFFTAGAGDVWAGLLGKPLLPKFNINAIQGHVSTRGLMMVRKSWASRRACAVRRGCWCCP